MRVNFVGTENPRVGGSSPPPGIFLDEQVTPEKLGGRIN